MVLWPCRKTPAQWDWITGSRLQTLTKQPHKFLYFTEKHLQRRSTLFSKQKSVSFQNHNFLHLLVTCGKNCFYFSPVTFLWQRAWKCEVIVKIWELATGEVAEDKQKKCCEIKVRLQTRMTLKRNVATVKTETGWDVERKRGSLQWIEKLEIVTGPKLYANI